ncbi:transposase [Streptomyces xanthophaeus]
MLPYGDSVLLDHQDPSLSGVQSPGSRPARYGTKKTTSWTGYWLHLTETCDDETPRLITDVATATAAAGDSEALPGIHSGLAERKLLPAEQLVDSGYVTASTLVTARREQDIELVGPASPVAGGDGLQRFGHDHFHIDDGRREAICPGGHTSVSWIATRSSRRTRVPLVQIRFDAAPCGSCPLRSQCTTAGNGKWGRALTLHEPAQRAALQQRRREQETDAWRERYRRREATVCQIVHRTHARRSRYRTAAATHLGHCLAATAVNLIRIDAWQQGHRPERTRTTHLRRLLARSSKVKDQQRGPSGRGGVNVFACQNLRRSSARVQTPVQTVPRHRSTSTRGQPTTLGNGYPTFGSWVGLTAIGCRAGQNCRHDDAAFNGG